MLVVCTGNICRSPAIAALITHGLRTLAGSEEIQVHSAGTQAAVGEPIHPATAAALRALAVPVPTSHRARQLVTTDVSSADLVLTATRAHRRLAVQAHPAAVARAFTLLELARLGEQVRALPTGPTAQRWRDLVGEARESRGLVRPERPEGDDVPDPIGRPDEVHAVVVKQCADAVEKILGRLGAVTG